MTFIVFQKLLAAGLDLIVATIINRCPYCTRGVDLTHLSYTTILDDKEAEKAWPEYTMTIGMRWS